MPLVLSFHGAAGTVTGSCFLLQSDSARVLIDCGMFQGSKTLKQLNYEPFPFDPQLIDAMLLTHAHIDHSGLIPKLMLAGFKRRIYTTQATIDLLGCMLPDSGHIQETEVESLNRRNKRRGLGQVTPIYTVLDAQQSLDLLEPVTYESWVSVAPGMRARWWNAGHLLGSASIEIEVQGEAGSKPKRILFSGDLGPDHKLLQPDPVGPMGFDIVICESTYGDRDRFEFADGERAKLLADEINAARLAGGALLIPSFAVERTQELVADIVGLMNSNTIPQAAIFIDSPLASKATDIFKRHASELQNGKALLDGLTSPNLHVTESVEESKALARFDGFHIIISASGMCDAGRIRHHLRNWLPERRATVLLVGFQAQGTLGRILKDGAKAVRIQGDDIVVRARISSIDSYSGHADGPELASWVTERKPVEQAVFLTHGEESAIEGLRSRLSGDSIIAKHKIFAPTMDDAFDIEDVRPKLIENRAPRRIAPEAASRPDWHNELSELLLNINDTMSQAADERARKIVIRRIKRALEQNSNR
ncbi:MAG: MBL fold metallo-hydrolase RNA specificity domain-containing protein [Beijerinckiaceae bacterium]